VIRLFDTLSKRYRLFPTKSRNKCPGARSRLRIFICGPTVYDYCHVGHARVFLFYDLVARFLRSAGASVVFVMNITDIDPKISVRAKQYGDTPEKVSEKFSLQLYTDLSLLGVTGISFARVSDYIPMAKKLALELVKKGAAYSLNGNVYLDTNKIKSFGRMSAISKGRLKNMRLDLAPGKRSQADLLLWNTADFIGYKYNDKILGSGFPSAHLQDLSVIVALFNGTYQLHGGATDLVYPHHESLLGQLVTLTSLKRPVQCWTHVGLLMSEGSKMSNSLGNAIPIRKILRRYNRNVIRLYFLSEHYRKAVHFSTSAIERLEKLDRRISEIVSVVRTTGDIAKCDEDPVTMKTFRGYVENDFDTIGILKMLTKIADDGRPSAKFLEILQILGLDY
jgi:cysteinyl-tRNA synthetase